MGKKSDLLWLTVARPFFPEWSDEETAEFEIIAATAYRNHPTGKIGQIYEQYVILKKLSDIN